MKNSMTIQRQGTKDCFDCSFNGPKENNEDLEEVHYPSEVSKGPAQHFVMTPRGKFRDLEAKRQCINQTNLQTEQVTAVEHYSLSGSRNTSL
jgi:hypothetical protein